VVSPPPTYAEYVVPATDSEVMVTTADEPVEAAVAVIPKAWKSLQELIAPAIPAATSGQEVCPLCTVYVGLRAPAAGNNKSYARIANVSPAFTVPVTVAVYLKPLN